MSGLQMLILLFVLLFELNAQRLHFRSLLKQYLGLGGDVDRAMLLPVSAQALLGFFQAFLDHRQLAFQKAQFLRGFRGLPIDGRVDVNVGDVVDRFSELLGLAALEFDAENIGILGNFLDRKSLLQLFDSGQRGFPGQLEMSARMGCKLCELNNHRHSLADVGYQRFAYLPFGQDFILGVQQLEPTFLQRDQRKRLAQITIRHREGSDFHFFAAPGPTAKSPP